MTFFDARTKAAADLKSIADAFKQLKGDLRLAEDIQRIASNEKEELLGGRFLIISQLTKQAGLMAGLASVKEGAGCFLTGVLLASTGFFEKESSLAIAGEGFQSYVKGLSKALIGGKAVSESERALFEKMLSLLLVSCAAFAGAFMRLAAKEEAGFLLGYVLLFLQRSGAVDAAAGAISSCFGSDGGRKKASDMIALACVMTVLAAASRGDGETFATMTGDFLGGIEGLWQGVQTFFKDQAIWQMASIALAEKNAQGFCLAWKGFYEFLGVSEDKFSKDLKKIADWAVEWIENKMIKTSETIQTTTFQQI